MLEMRPRKFYATRHTFISVALSKGCNLKWVAEYCGTSVEMIEKSYGIGGCSGSKVVPGGIEPPFAT